MNFSKRTCMKQKIGDEASKTVKTNNKITQPQH